MIFLTVPDGGFAAIAAARQKAAIATGTGGSHMHKKRTVPRTVRFSSIQGNRGSYVAERPEYEKIKIGKYDE